ncbi:uncharacterized protein PFL1_02210 [Pseudozyma flocculosa PF-1]|uniref:Related to RSM7 - mitochondrial ribosomal protein, small subunit n=1 Tax=Pseudozyma flocculosa TaxID=84751 RepID=A0A5C3FB22_9BASI|nr:uncharacterized protein PFL1_02210 [Pseudozyma flocculosa PF-1]EPQ30093.1 hypothetical protein PFL1_02210 [Pseudozyma flocculosa PF-1]SPO41440.1 related to RSM7 - mitochondrial ribosomal protein, small subunit [Pseudozyma flocculosa]
MSLPLPALRSSVSALARGRTAAPLAFAASSGASTSRTLLTTPRLFQQNGESPARSHRPRSASQNPSQLHSKNESQGISAATGLETSRSAPGIPTGNASTERNEQTYATAKGMLDEFAQQLSAQSNSKTSPGATASGPATTTTPPSPPPTGATAFASPHSAPPPPTTPLSAQAYSPTALPPRADPLLTFLTNLLMKSGKKAQSERFVTHALSHIRTLTNADPLPLLYSAVEQVRPLVKMQSRKQGGKNMQVPIALTQRQSERKALTWIIDASKKRSDRDISVRLAKEFVAIVEGSSAVNSRKEEQHKIATANRANAAVRV